MDQDYQGVTAADGAEYHVEADGERSPFRAYLDIGLARATTGANIFGVLKGAVDGGLDIPHKCKRFPGYNAEEKSYDADAHRARIFGSHVSSWMDELEEKDQALYQRQFSAYVAAGITSEDIEGMYERVHAAIRANPTRTTCCPTEGAKTQPTF
eukprot:gnl/Ergobibamus_cyprinoides/1898.p2 GENE.gnl/Ergobibamus_cyprinoides/1898~~gnl/Ergobibamus_cyprinoides/1898.p2  ORF type:complete len:154 (+),score=69.38 gnl/Ergobibamus_cyprinoides/1898:2-463(+)